MRILVHRAIERLGTLGLGGTLQVGVGLLHFVTSGGTPTHSDHPE